MPTVPRLERRERLQPVPGGGALAIPAGTFGGLPKTQATILKIQQEETRALNNAVVLESDIALRNGANRILINAKGKFSGRNAGGAGQFTDTEYKKLAQEERGKAQNDEQRNSIEQKISLHGGSLQNNTLKYTVGEAERYKTVTTGAWLSDTENKLSEVDNYVNPANYNFGIEEMEAVLTDFYRGDTALVEQDLQEHIDVINATAIESLLVNGQDQLARELYNERKEAISVDVRNSIEKSLNEGSVRGDSQRATDKIIAKDLPLKEAVAQARKIKDPEVRDEAVKRVKQYYKDVEAVEKQELEDAYLGAVNAMERPENAGRTPRDVIPPGDWTQFTVAQRNALEKRAEEIVESDPKAWGDFLSLTPKQLAALPRSEFEAKYWSKFDNTHKNRADTRWVAARDAQEKGTLDSDPKLTTLITDSQRAENAFTSVVGVKPTAFPKLFATFERELERRINDFNLTALGGKREASQREKDNIANELLMEGLMTEVDTPGFFSLPVFRHGIPIPRSFLGEEGDIKPFAELTEEEKKELSKTLSAEAKKGVIRSLTFQPPAIAPTPPPGPAGLPEGSVLTNRVTKDGAPVWRTPDGKLFTQ